MTTGAIGRCHADKTVFDALQKGRAGKWGVLLWLGLFLVVCPTMLLAQGSRVFAPPPMITRWGKAVNPDKVLPEYPRPTMVRADWLNLNGRWDYSVTRRTQAETGSFTNKILVPFPIEAPLSGVKRLFTDKQQLWYRRKFQVPPAWKGRRVLLHFEAVDWEARVWINGKEMGSHRGGYDRFSFDITDTLQTDGEQELVVSVIDPSDGGYQPHGKQQQQPRDIFYTACSGIWQTVWLEPVAESSVESLKLIPDIDAGVLKATVLGQGETNGATVEATAWDGTNEVGEARGKVGKEFQLSVPNARLWSPDTPFLYDLRVMLLRDGKKLDEVSSYFGMRQISVAKDDSGFPRLMLNHKRVFQLGPLDHGYWPDGLYTAPSDEALKSDIEGMKKLGFNMCRKHVKIEPERWYHWCDRLGLLVWQDMPNGDRLASPDTEEITRSAKSAQQFETELKQMVLGRGNHPCIVIWIPFNQGWGQYDTVRIASLVKELDPSRLVIDASGWFDMGVGNVRSLHQYPGPPAPQHDGNRACVIGECGALGIGISGHMWRSRISPWNLTPFKTVEALTLGYESLLSRVQALEEKQGLSGAVITQWTDVETSCDGFMTYDREVIKMPQDRIRAANRKVMDAVIEPAKR